jgi:hypothetical protein
VRDVIQATLLGSLLFLDRADLLREWQQSGGAAAALAAAAAAAAGPDQTAGKESVLHNRQAQRCDDCRNLRRMQHTPAAIAGSGC